jgi:cytochrome P450
MRFRPAYPDPARGPLSRIAQFLRARHSWLDTLSERAYRMHMGEVHLPGVDLYMLNQPELVREVLVTCPEAFPKNELLAEALRPLLGDSILTTNGAAWKRQRSMMDPAFAHARLDAAFPAMRAAADAMLGRLAARGDGAPLDVELEMTHVTADIIFRTIFSEPLDGADARRVFHAFARYQSIAPRLMLPALFGLRWLASPWARRASRSAAQEIRGLLAAMIEPRWRAHAAGVPPAQPDILQSFIEARDPVSGHGFSFDELVDQVAMLFLAGHETSASALTWASWLLANDPEIQERAHREAREVLGRGEPSPTEIRRLGLIWNVFRETLRLFPPIGFFAREAGATCPMRDKTVPAGASLIISPWLIHRHRLLWKDPDLFDPDRYAAEGAKESQRNAYLPFGMGQRVCLGAAFAQQEAALILAKLLREYRIETVPGHVPRPIGRITIRSSNGVRLRFVRRSRVPGAPAEGADRHAEERAR